MHFYAISKKMHGVSRARRIGKGMLLFVLVLGCGEELMLDFLLITPVGRVCGITPHVRFYAWSRRIARCNQKGDTGQHTELDARTQYSINKLSHGLNLKRMIPALPRNLFITQNSASLNINAEIGVILIIQILQ